MEGVKIEGGFAEIGAGAWLMGRAQPAAFFGTARRLPRKGWRVPDRGALELVETSAAAKCADAAKPFLTHIPCAATVFAVSSKVLVAPAKARKNAAMVRVVPMSARGAFVATEFAEEWLVTATESRTARIVLAEEDTLCARPEAVVAWTCKAPTGYCPRLTALDLILPRNPANLMLTFYGPGIVWVEGSNAAAKADSIRQRRIYGF